jgi:hypothetical protein
MIGTPAVYIAHFPDGTVQHLIYEYEDDLIRDFKDRAEVTIIRVEAQSVDVFNPDTYVWEEAPKEYA